MFPIRDHNPSGSVPFITVGLIIANILAFLHELRLGPELEPFLHQFGLVPLRVSNAIQRIPDPALLASAGTFFTSIFLHGGWLHLLGNMWYLWIFGDNIEDRLGHIRFLMFYLSCGLIAGIVQYVIFPYSKLPTIGASGAVAGVLGAYFCFFPRARVDVFIIFIFFIRIIQVQAGVILIFWFLLQFLNGYMTISTSTDLSGGVAWWAHIGGFLFGIVFVFLLPNKRDYRVTRFRPKRRKP